MKLVTSNGELDLPVDFSFELEYNNPFFSDEGDAMFLPPFRRHRTT